MKLLQRLERKLQPFAIRQAALYLIAGQAICWAMIRSRPELAGMLALVPEKVLRGEYWRLLSFLVEPMAENPIWLFFALYMFWLMSSALEQTWGTVRFNLYLLVGYLASIGCAFLVPGEPATNAFLEGSVFLAFAFLFPDFVIYIFFILPVRVKWLALLAWVGYGFTLIFGDWMSRVLALAAIGNFLLFFWRGILDRIRMGRRHMKYQANNIRNRPAGRDRVFHTCSLCGVTDRENPAMEFRYCSECKPAQCFCMEHIHKHQHQRAGEAIGLK